MTFSDFISFVVSVGVLTFLYFRRKRQEKHRREHPEQEEAEEKEREKRLRLFLKSLEGDMEEQEEEMKKPPPPPPEPKVLAHKPRRSVKDNFALKTKLEDFKTKTEVEDRQLHTKITQQSFEEFGKRVSSEVMSEDMSMATQADEAYRIKVEHEASRLLKVLEHLPERRYLFVMQEVIGRPKALRPSIKSYDYP